MLLSRPAILGSADLTALMMLSVKGKSITAELSGVVVPAQLALPLMRRLPTRALAGAFFWWGARLMVDWTFALSRLEKEGEGMPWSRITTSLFGLAFVAPAFFCWTVVHYCAGWVGGEGAAAVACDWLCRSGTRYGYFQKPAAVASAAPEPLPWPKAFVPHVAGE